MKNYIFAARQLSGMMVFILVILFWFTLFFGVPVYADPVWEKDLLLTEEYRNLISETTRELDTLKEDLEWLELKIMDRNYLEQSVPSRLYTSVLFKKNRMDALEKKLQHYNKCLEKIAAKRPLAQVALIEQMKKNKIFNWFELVQDQNYLEIKTTLPILFASGSAVVTGDYDAFLTKVAAFVKDYRVWIIVDGFADTDPINTQQFPSNFELGAIRAANVVHALVDKGVDPTVFKVASTGRYRFPDARHMSEKKALERYINITILFETT